MFFLKKCFITICQYWTTGASYETQCLHCQSICVHSCGPFITSLFYLIVSSCHISSFLFYSPMNQSCERCGKVLHNSRCIDPFAFYAIHSAPLLSQSDDTAVFYGSAYFQRKLPYSGWRSWESASLTLLSCTHRVALFLYHTHSIFLDLQKVFVTFFMDLHWIWWKHKIQTKQLITF